MFLIKYIKLYAYFLFLFIVCSSVLDSYNTKIVKLTKHKPHQQFRHLQPNRLTCIPTLSFQFVHHCSKSVFIVHLAAEQIPCRKHKRLNEHNITHTATEPTIKTITATNCVCLCGCSEKYQSVNNNRKVFALLPLDSFFANKNRIWCPRPKYRVVLVWPEYATQLILC